MYMLLRNQHGLSKPTGVSGPNTPSQVSRPSRSRSRSFGCFDFLRLPIVASSFDSSFIFADDLGTWSEIETEVNERLHTCAIVHAHSELEVERDGHALPGGLRLYTSFCDFPGPATFSERQHSKPSLPTEDSSTCISA